MSVFSQRNREKISQKKLEMNTISLTCCKNIHVGDVLYYTIEEPLTALKTIRNILKIFMATFFPNSYTFHVSGNPHTLALYSNSYRGRKDQMAAFMSATNLLTDCVQMCASKRNFDLLGFKYLWLPFVWVNQMRKAEPSIYIRIHYTFVLFQAFLDYKIWERKKRKNGWNIHHLLTYCDVKPVDCFFVQKFNFKNIATTTFQHGTFNINVDPWEYQGSKSANFLAENPMATDNARTVGYMGNIIVVGSPHLLRQKRIMGNKENCDGIIGVIMNSPEQPHDDNIAMLITLQKYCAEHKKKLYVKWHPSDDTKSYSDIVDNTLTKTFGSEIMVEEFANKIEYAIVSASTAFLTMLGLRVPTFLFIREGHDPNLFRNVEKLKFTTSKELDTLIFWSKTSDYEQEIIKIKDYLLPSGNIKENYKNAFQSLGLACKFVN